MSESDIKASTVTSTGTVASGRHRIRGLHYAGSAGGDAVIVLRDGGASGTTVLDLGGLTDQTDDVTIPGRGILCNTDIHATLTNVASLTIFYE